jgi:His/Glu/Gln/Arg/opine family amino acid ABC transporter permease subunit
MEQFINNIGQFVNRFNQAAIITIELSLISLLLACVIGIIVGLINSTKSKSFIIKFLKFICNVYIYIIRGTPMLVQILIIYFGIAQVFRPLGFNWTKLGGAFGAGVVALMLNAGAYLSEIVRGGIESVDNGQIEAARSLGLPYSKTMIKIVLPQAFRTMLPTIINQFIISIKDTSLISAIGVAELTNVGKTIASKWSSQTMLLYLWMAAYYLIICSILTKLSKVVEKRLTNGK